MTRALLAIAVVMVTSRARQNHDLGRRAGVEVEDDGIPGARTRVGDDFIWGKPFPGVRKGHSRPQRAAFLGEIKVFCDILAKALVRNFLKELFT